MGRWKLCAGFGPWALLGLTLSSELLLLQSSSNLCRRGASQAACAATSGTKPAGLQALRPSTGPFSCRLPGPARSQSFGDRLTVRCMQMLVEQLI
ncbi:hypothetical protein BDA96_09G224900 [Sorghum bicolor]|uniref:Uncharacterized protein n=1 Tax=Sorghum bicolor TaxID=4558 RepID=A0A921QC33_SORBI|nr:hypothetical protein BDA96_09G224900 [Sorghum bicolor]